MNPIFPITSIKNNDQRCIGFFHNFDEANEYVLNFGNIIREDYYEYVVIEKKFPGAYCLETFQEWFIWNGKSYESCEVPNEYRNVINFAIG